MIRATAGVDIGGTSAKLGALAADGRVLDRASVPTGKSIGASDFVSAVARAVEALAERTGADIAAVGVGSAGLVDTASGVVRRSPNLPEWRDVPLRRLLSDALGRPVRLLNDADAFALGEYGQGAGRGTRTGVYLTLGTGVGGAIVLDGVLFRGAFGMAGEAGHMTVDVNGARCPCGGRGCLELTVGSAHIVEAATALVRSGADGRGLREAAGDGDLSPQTIALAATRGDVTATRVFDRVGEVLGLFVVGLTNLLSPDVVVIGGGVAGAGPPLWRPLESAVSRYSLSPVECRPALEPAALGTDAGWLGAATLARDASGG